MSGGRALPQRILHTPGHDMERSNCGNSRARGMQGGPRGWAPTSILLLLFPAFEQLIEPLSGLARAVLGRAGLAQQLIQPLLGACRRRARSLSPTLEQVR